MQRASIMAAECCYKGRGAADIVSGGYMPMDYSEL